MQIWHNWRKFYKHTTQLQLRFNLLLLKFSPRSLIATMRRCVCVCWRTYDHSDHRYDSILHRHSDILVYFQPFDCKKKKNSFTGKIIQKHLKIISVPWDFFYFCLLFTHCRSGTLRGENKTSPHPMFIRKQNNNNKNAWQSQILIKMWTKINVIMNNNKNGLRDKQKQVFLLVVGATNPFTIRNISMDTF